MGVNISQAAKATIYKSKRFMLWGRKGVFPVLFRGSINCGASTCSTCYVLYSNASEPLTSTPLPGAHRHVPHLQKLNVEPQAHKFPILYVRRANNLLLPEKDPLKPE